MNRHFGVSERILQDFDMLAFLTGATFTAFASAQQTSYERIYDDIYFMTWGSTFTRARLATAVLGYRLLIDWTKRDCMCPDCKEAPSAYIIDGVVVGIPREQLNGMVDPRQPTAGVTARGVSYQERSYIPSDALTAKELNLLLSFVRAPPPRPCPIGTELPHISKDDPAPRSSDVQLLVDSFNDDERHESLRGLFPLLSEAVNCAVRLTNNCIVCDPALAHLIYPFVCHSTASVFHRPKETAAALRAFIDSTDIAQDPNVLPNIQKFMPWVNFFWRDTGMPMTLPPYARLTCESIVNFALNVAEWEQRYTIDGSDAGHKSLQQLIGSPLEVEREAAKLIIAGEKFTNVTEAEDRRRGMWTLPFLRRQITDLTNYDVGPINRDQYGQKVPECIKCAPSTHSHSPGIMSVVCTHGEFIPIFVYYEFDYHLFTNVSSCPPSFPSFLSFPQVTFMDFFL